MTTAKKSRTTSARSKTFNPGTAKPDAAVEAPRWRRSRQRAITSVETSVEGQPRPISKKATIESLVHRKGGATIHDLTIATGWQEHSVRAALTGLRKAGSPVARDRNQQGKTVYRIMGAS